MTTLAPPPAPAQEGRHRASNRGQSTNSQIATWVKKHGTAVSAYSGLYRLNASDAGWPFLPHPQRGAAGFSPRLPLKPP
ncbi:hypothetical protein ABZZ74_05260 [Streptomyces sp. NPDC006476]|uniref:hypothetical protein n=1 Tax=Streptomyces sp. NPDC006476 TaxID=3157175 RepID=UPI0033B52B03